MIFEQTKSVDSVVEEVATKAEAAAAAVEEEKKAPEIAAAAVEEEKKAPEAAAEAAPAAAVTLSKEEAEIEVLKMLEFYFGDSNYSWDRFMQSKVPCTRPVHCPLLCVTLG